MNLETTPNQFMIVLVVFMKFHHYIFFCHVNVWFGVAMKKRLEVELDVAELGVRVNER